MRFIVKFYPVTSSLTAAELAAGEDYINNDRHVEEIVIDAEGMDAEAFASAAALAAPQKNLRVIGDVDAVLGLNDGDPAHLWLAEYADIESGESDDDEVMYVLGIRCIG